VRAAVATGGAIAAVIHHRAATVPVISLPVWIEHPWSPRKIVIGTAPDAARYCSARLRLGAFASMAGIDSGISGRRHGKSPGRAPTLAETGRCNNSMFSDYRRGLHLLETTQMWSHPIFASKNRPHGGFA
jgi:hypothetical protein